jgi:hypothetical protein
MFSVCLCQRRVAFQIQVGVLVCFTQSQVFAVMSAGKPLETRVFLSQQEAVSNEVHSAASRADSKELLLVRRKPSCLT